MTRVDRERRQDREDLLAEHGVELGQLALADLLVADDRDPRAGQGRGDLAPVEGDLARDQPLDPRANRPQLFDRRQAVGGGHRHGGEDLLFETGDAYLEEIVQVLAEDRQEAHAFEDGQASVLRHRQDPFVEVEPGELAVDVARADGGGDGSVFGPGVGSGGHEGNFTPRPATPG